MAFKLSDLKISDDVLGEVFYGGFIGFEETVDGEKKRMQRHEVYSEKHGFFHVLTPVLSVGFVPDERVIVENGSLLRDDINGRGMSASKNVIATGMRKG